MATAALNIKFTPITVLLTGGTGYIGSHTALVLHQASYPVLLLDNLGNSNRAVLDRLEAISGHWFEFVQGDVASYFAKADKAPEELNWKAFRDLNEMCRSAWAWQQNMLRR